MPAWAARHVGSGGLMALVIVGVALVLGGAARGWLVIAVVASPTAAYWLATGGARRAAQVTSSRSDGQARLAFEAGRMGWWSWDPDAQLLHWSDEMGLLYGHPRGWSPSDGTGLSVVHPEDRGRVAHAFAEVQRDGGGHVLPYRIVWPDGSIRWLDAEVRVSTDPERLVTGVVRDVTDVELLRDALTVVADQLRLLLETTTNGIVVREGPTLRPSLINPAAQRMLGIDAEDVPAYLAGEKRWSPLDEDGEPLSVDDTPDGVSARSWSALPTSRPSVPSRSSFACSRRSPSTRRRASTCWMPMGERSGSTPRSRP